MAKKRVLFLCTGNSARSQMAEGILRNLAGDQFEVFSAGTEPKGIHPQTIKVMNQIGIDVGRHRSKHVNEFLGEKLDYVISVCDRARQNCPILPGATSYHWGFDDPADAPPDRQEKKFIEIRDEISRRIRLFLLANGIDSK